MNKPNWYFLSLCNFKNNFCDVKAGMILEYNQQTGEVFAEEKIIDPYGDQVCMDNVWIPAPKSEDGEVFGLLFPSEYITEISGKLFVKTPNGLPEHIPVPGDFIVECRDEFMNKRIDDVSWFKQHGGCYAWRVVGIPMSHDTSPPKKKSVIEINRNYSPDEISKMITDLTDKQVIKMSGDDISLPPEQQKIWNEKEREFMKKQQDVIQKDKIKMAEKQKENEEKAKLFDKINNQ